MSPSTTHTGDLEILVGPQELRPRRVTARAVPKHDVGGLGRAHLNVRVQHPLREVLRDALWAVLVVRRARVFTVSLAASARAIADALISTESLVMYLAMYMPAFLADVPAPSS